MPKRTKAKAKNRRKQRKHGFLQRMKTKAGKRVLKSRRKKGRKRISA